MRLVSKETAFVVRGRPGLIAQTRKERIGGHMVVVAASIGDFARFASRETIAARIRALRADGVRVDRVLRIQRAAR